MEEMNIKPGKNCAVAYLRFPVEGVEDMPLRRRVAVKL
jgi:hypothetical protein